MKNGPYELVIPPADFPGRRYRGRYAYQHTVVWWQNTGEAPPPGSVIHHKNLDKRDNRFENLELERRGEHSREHNKARDTQKVWLLCDECEREMSLLPGVLKKRLSNNTIGIFCSRSCGAKRRMRILHRWPTSKAPDC